MKKAVRRIDRLVGIVFAALAIAWGFLLIASNDPALAANRALLVGVEDYPNPKMKLRGIRDDVSLLENALTTAGLFRRDEIKTLLDKQAVKTNIIASFRRWLIEETGKGDTVLFYFSGHGARVWSHHNDKPDGMDSALICWDTVSSKRPEKRKFREIEGEAFDLSATRNMLLGRELHGLLKRLQGRRVIFMSDSCHSGTVYKQIDPFFVQIKTIMSEPVEYKSVFEDRVSSVPGTADVRKAPRITYDFEIPGVDFVAFTASEDSQLAQVYNFQADPKGPHSVFTWFLFHGLSGKADNNGDGSITFGKLAEFIGREVKKAGFAQDPQTVFSPRSLADQPLVKKPVTAQRPEAQAPAASDSFVRPRDLACVLEAGPGVSASDVQMLKSRLERAVPVVKWSDRRDQVSCRVVLEKVAGNYGARLSDASGDYWEAGKGPDLEALALGMAGNLRAYYIQTVLTALNNPSGRRQVNMNLVVKGPRQRARGEAVQGDSIQFETETKSGGYPYLFSVDTVGVIHPLFPIPNTEVRELQPGASGFLGSENAFTVAEPFGKEMVFAVMLDKPSAHLASLWAQDHIGDARQESFQPQQRFLETLWNELTASGKPKGDWTSQTWLIRSFRQ